MLTLLSSHSRRMQLDRWWHGIDGESETRIHDIEPVLVPNSLRHSDKTEAHIFTTMLFHRFCVKFMLIGMWYNFNDFRQFSLFMFDFSCVADDVFYISISVFPPPIYNDYRNEAQPKLNFIGTYSTG